MNLPYGAFLLYRKESWIDAMNQTKDGRDILKAIWRLQQTKADEAAIAEYNEGRTMK